MDFEGQLSNRCGNVEIIDLKRRSSNRKRIIEKRSANDEAIRAASGEKNPLSPFPDFRFYCKHGLSVYLKSSCGEKLSYSVKKYVQNLLKINMEGPYGSEWSAEEKVKRKEIIAPESRYILVYESLNTNHSLESSTVSEEERIVGFVHYRFVTEEGIPVLYVYELQLEPRVQGKGLGKFLMRLIELIAQKNAMGAVMLTVQKRNSGAISFYMTNLGYVVSAISPSRMNIMGGNERSYEILCKTFSDESKPVLG